MTWLLFIHSDAKLKFLQADNYCVNKKKWCIGRRENTSQALSGPRGIKFHCAAGTQQTPGNGSVSRAGVFRSDSLLIFGKFIVGPNARTSAAVSTCCLPQHVGISTKWCILCYSNTVHHCTIITIRTVKPMWKGSLVVMNSGVCSPPWL